MRNLPENPNLHHLKGQAKTLLQTWQTQDPKEPRKLADAQHAVAQDYGFPTWADLKHHVEALAESRLDPDAWLLRAMTGRVYSAPSPTHIRQNPFIAAAVADLPALKEHLAQNPDLPIQTGGPLQTTALNYLCCSSYNGGDPVPAARLLLENGADPNAPYEDPNWPGNPLPPLWGACGKRYDAALAELLLQHGANPNDNESLYHATESPDTGCLQALLNHGAKVIGSNAIYHALDYDRLEPVRLLLEHGGDPDDPTMKENTLHHAIRRGRNVEFAKLLVKHGARLDTKSMEGLDLLRHASLRANAAWVDYLRSLGLTTELSPLDQFVAAVTQNNVSRANDLLAQDPDLPKSLQPIHHRLPAEAAWAGDQPRIARYLQNGWPVDPPAIPMGRFLHPNSAGPLHVACFRGDFDLTNFLIAQGADLNRVESQYKATPIGWAIHAAVNAYQDTEPGQHAECIEALLKAGATPPRNPTTGHPQIDQILKKYK